MNPRDIKVAIVSAGTSQRAIADYLGVHPQSVNAVVNGRMRSARIEGELEKIVGRPVFGPKKQGGRRKTTWTGRIDERKI